MIVAAKTHKGLVREKNEDCFFIDDLNYRLFVVADGMGGHKAGEIASHEAVEIIKAEFLNAPNASDYESIMRTSFEKTNAAIFEKASASSDMEGMGTTLTVLFVEGDILHFGHVGDSRAYFVGRERLEQITTDHTLVEQLILNGTLAREDAGKHPNRNVITKAVGVDKSLEIDYFTRNKEQERVLLCSDGLTDSLNDDEIFEIVKNSASATNAVQSLVAHSNKKGGHDNITVVLIEFSEKVREVEA